MGRREDARVQRFAAGAVAGHDDLAIARCRAAAHLADLVDRANRAGDGEPGRRELAMRLRLLSIVAVFALASPAFCAEEPPNRIEGVGTLIFGGRAAEARTCLIDAIAAYGKEHDLEHQAVSEYLLALSDAALNDDPAARAHFDDAVLH